MKRRGGRDNKKNNRERTAVGTKKESETGVIDIEKQLGLISHPPVRPAIARRGSRQEKQGLDPRGREGMKTGIFVLDGEGKSRELRVSGL